MKIVSFWHGPRIRNLDMVCVASWVKLGYEVEIYSFAPIEAVPQGVVLRDAAEVLSAKYLEMLKPVYRQARQSWQPVVNYSDLFRIALMQQGRGLWLDMDIALFRPLQIDPARPYFAWEDRSRIGSPVFYVPQGEAMLADYGKLFETPDLMPHWLGFVRGWLRPTVWRAMGRQFSPPDLGITIYGNDAFTRLAKKHDLARFALPKRSFYAWNAAETMRFYDPAHGEDLQGDPAVFGLHVHHKPHPNLWPAPGSLFARTIADVADLLPPMQWEGRD
jgi:hypothetical protein